MISYVDQVRLQKFLEKSKKTKKEKIVSESDAELKSTKEEQERLRKKVTQLMKKQKVPQLRKIVKQHDDSRPWGQEVHVKV